MTARRHLQMPEWLLPSSCGPWPLRVYDLRQKTDQNRDRMEFKGEALLGDANKRYRGGEGA